MDVANILDMALASVNSLEECKRKFRELQKLAKFGKDEDPSDSHILMSMAALQRQIVDTRNTQARILIELVILRQKTRSANGQNCAKVIDEAQGAVVAELDHSIRTDHRDSEPAITICPSCADQSVISVLVRDKTLDNCHHCGGSFRANSSTSVSHPRSVRTRPLDS